MPTQRVYWNRAQDGTWAEFFAVDLDDAHFEALDGVFVVWQGGSQPAAISAGFGALRKELKALRTDPAIALFRGKPLFVSWAKVEESAREGVARYLVETLKPRRPAAAAAAPPVSVNLPGRGDEAPSDVTAPPPRQFRENKTAPVPSAPEAGPAAESSEEEKLPLHAEFQKILASGKDAPKGFFAGSGGKPAPNEEKEANDAVQLILRSALRLRASDVHLEPQEGHLRVRFRIDGSLEEVLRVKNSHNLRLVSSLRVTCGLGSEKGPGGKPEDGRATVSVDGRETDLRLSTFPTAHGDKAVLRATSRAAKPAALGELGLEPGALELLRSLLARGQGLIVATGPAGSGRTTTLYAALESLNEASRNVVTLEDPIERKLPGIAQGALLPKQGYGYAEGLRTVLRQDADAVMFGELGDAETAELALRAALAGRLLLTSMHATSALGALERLLDMGLEPFLPAWGVAAATSQRLARAVCPACVRPYAPTAVDLADTSARARKAGVALPLEFGSHLKAGVGCEACRGTGYQGRLLLFEAAAVTPPLREALLAGKKGAELRAAAARGGMEPMFLDGLRKAADGRTTLSEVFRVVDSAA